MGRAVVVPEVVRVSRAEEVTVISDMDDEGGLNGDGGGDNMNDMEDGE